MKGKINAGQLSVPVNMKSCWLKVFPFLDLLVKWQKDCRKMATFCGKSTSLLLAGQFIRVQILILSGINVNAEFNY